MFGGKRPNYNKLRTNLRLCINRLKLLEKKKTELALKARKEIADYIGAGKDDRARIRVEHIVREDYLVEAMEIVEMFCDLLLARFGLIDKMKDLDPGLEETIATIIWVSPRLSADVQEIREVANQLTLKYGKEFADMCRTNGFDNVNEKVMHKMSIAAPPKYLVEQYMIEISKTYNVPFVPDPFLLDGSAPPQPGNLVDLIGLEKNDSNQPGGGAGGGGGGGGLAPLQPHAPPSVYPGPQMPMPHSHSFPPGAASEKPPLDQPSFPPSYSAGPPPPMPGHPPHMFQGGSVPPPLPSQPPVAGGPFPPGMPPGAGGPFPPGMPPGAGGPPSLPGYYDVFGHPANPTQGPPPGSQATYPGANSGGNLFSQPGGGAINPTTNGVDGTGLPDIPTLPDIPNLPSVPTGGSVGMDSAADDIDFDDLTKRFENLKKKKVPTATLR